MNSRERLFRDHWKFINPYWADFLSGSGLLRRFTRADGLYLMDDAGNRFLDLVAGFGSVNIGHNHPILLAAIENALDARQPSLTPWGLVPEAGTLAGRLIRLAGNSLGKVHFASGGGEAVESALKFAMASTRRDRFICVQGDFHGVTTGATAVAGDRIWQDPFPKMPLRVTRLNQGDWPRLEKTLSKRSVAGVIIEIVQGTGASAPWSSSDLERLSGCARKNGTLVIVDEVLTGLGRTGRWFAFQQGSFCPDIVVVSKGLTGGLLPVSAVIMTDQVFFSGITEPAIARIQDSTFFGNRLAMVCGVTVLDVVEHLQLVRNAKDIGAYFRKGLTSFLDAGLIEEIVGAGLLISFKLPARTGGLTGAHSLWMELYSRGVLVNVSHKAGWIKLTPPLTLDKKGVAFFLDALGDSLSELTG